MMLTLPKCEYCKKFHEDDYSCDVFPEGIPDNVMWKPKEKECRDGIYFEEED